MAKGLTDVEIIGILKTYVKKSLIGQGALKGQDGFSPTVVVKTNTDSEYVLTITDANGSYDTPNLRASGGGGNVDVTLLADEFSTENRYAKGDVVAYQGKLYQYLTNHEKGAWDASQVYEVPNLELLFTYGAAVRNGYRNNYEEKLYHSLLTSSGNLANNMLGEIVGDKYQIGPALNSLKWVNDTLTYDAETDRLYWCGPDPNAPSESDKTAICRLNLSTGEIESGDLNLPKSTWTDTKSTVAREIAFYGDYIYVAVRSGDNPRPVQASDILGALVCVRKSDLSVVWTQKMDARCCGVKVYEATNGTVYLMLSGRMEYLKLYTVDKADPQNITLTDTVYFETYPIENVENRDLGVYELQKGQFYETENGDVWFIGAGFGDGVHIWDVTSGKAIRIGNFSFGSNRGLIPSDTFHTQSCVIKYPYVYATLGPDGNKARPDFNNGTNIRRMGLLTLDISDLSHIVGTKQLIAIDDMCDFFDSGDPKPIYITMYEDKLFLANGNKGVAVYDISRPSKPLYLGTKFCSEINDVGGMAIVGKKLYVGDYGIVKLGVRDLVYRTPKYIKGFEIYSDYKGMASGEDSGYGALIDAGIMEDFKDASKYPANECVDLTKMSGANDAAKLQAAISSGKTILVPHGVYDLAGTAINFPLNRIVSIIGENANSCVFKNCNFKATGGLSLKNLTLDGGTKTSIDGLSWQPVVIIDATPKVDTAAHTYINCIFKGNGTTHYASEASQEREDLSYNGINRFKIAKDIVDNCVFDGFIYSGVNHCITVDYASFTNNTFRNIGIVDDVPFDLVASPSGSPKSQSLAENTENVYEEVQNPTGNPKTQGWFQQTDGNYVKTSDTSVVEAHLPYYEIKAPVGTFFCSTDSSVNATKRYYKPKGRYVGALRLGDASGNNVNEVVQCTLYHNNFENIFNNEYYWDVTHCDECNFIKIRARYITVTHNRFKDLVGYGGDREGVYVKAFYADISYNYIENGGMGEGYICCKNIKTSEYDPNGFELVPNPSGNPKTEGWFEKETPVTDPPTYKKTSDTSVKANKEYFTGTLIHQRDWLKRFVHIHDNVLIGYGGRGIRTYYNATVENNTVYIRNAKSAIWSGGDQSNTDALLYRFYTNSIIENNKVSIGFDKFYLTNPKTLALYASVVVAGKGIEPTDYHARTEAIVGINDGRTVISGNTVTVEMADALNATLASWYYAYKAIFFQNTRELVECTDNQIITNGTKVVSGASNVKLIGIMATWEDYKLFPYVKGITINICKNDILDGYNPMHLNLVGLTKAETIVNVKGNTVWNPSEVYGGRVNRGCELEMYDKKTSNDNTDKKTSLVFTSPQINAGFTTAYVCTDCDNVETENISWVQHVASLA